MATLCLDARLPEPPPRYLTSYDVALPYWNGCVVAMKCQVAPGGQGGHNDTATALLGLVDWRWLHANAGVVVYGDAMLSVRAARCGGGGDGGGGKVPAPRDYLGACFGEQ